VELKNPQASTDQQGCAKGKAEAGGDSTIMPLWALPPMGPWWLSEVLFPPPALTSGQPLRYLKYPKVGSREDPPLRPERHSPYSIATIKKIMIILPNSRSR